MRFESASPTDQGVLAHGRRPIRSAEIVGLSAVRPTRTVDRSLLPVFN